jgi:microtubule-associated protein-like 6
MQWLHEADGYEEEAGTLEANPEDALDLADGKVLDKPAVWEMANAEDMAYTFAMEEQARDEDFTPVKPWQRTIVAPSQFEENVNEPDDTLVLEWVHGYRGADCRSNLTYGKGGVALYHVGATAIRMNVKESAQAFYQDAKDEIMCLCVHPDRPICAIGEAGNIPYAITPKPQPPPPPVSLTPPPSVTSTSLTMRRWRRSRPSPASTGAP